MATSADTGANEPLERASAGDTASMLGLADRMKLMRATVMQQLGLAYGGARDYYNVLGYRHRPDADDFRGLWERGDVAETIIDLPAETAWRDRPDVVDHADQGTDEEAATEFEEAVDDLFDDHQLLHYLKRWDKALGMGQYGLLMLGLAESDEPDADQLDADAPSLADPAEEGDYSYEDLAYLSVFTQQSVVDLDLVTNPMHPRYGDPAKYRLELAAAETGTRNEDVHYTRVLHAAENLLDNEIYGKSRLLPLLNRLDDREKILGGSAEAYWRSADRRLHLDYGGDNQAGRPADADDVAEEAEEMIHGLRSVLTTSNTDMTTIQGSDPDPSGAIEANRSALAGTSGIPQRILTGSERGELASTQDRASFYGRIMERREQFCGPMMLRPLLKRLTHLGVLPEPTGGGFDIEWDNLFELNELEQAQLMLDKAKAIKNAAPMGDPGAIATDEEIRENVFEWDPVRGEETSAPTESEDPTDDDITDEPPDAVEEMEEILERVDGDGARAIADGGE